MPAAIKLRIVSARDLPVMDSPTDSTDAYVEVCFADTPHLRTRVEKRTLNPTWNQEFRIEVADDCDLQDCPLVLKCIDKDIMSSDDEIGAVCIDLNPLLMQQEQVQLAGWFPLYDSLRGACGELSIVVKMDFVGDVNPFKESGAGVQFLSATLGRLHTQCAPLLRTCRAGTGHTHGLDVSSLGRALLPSPARAA